MIFYMNMWFLQEARIYSSVIEAAFQISVPNVDPCVTIEHQIAIFSSCTQWKVSPCITIAVALQSNKCGALQLQHVVL